MEIITTTPELIDKSTVQGICNITALGFERKQSEEMLNDTIGHIAYADYIQVASKDSSVVGFAMHKNCLWR